MTGPIAVPRVPAQARTPAQAPLQELRYHWGDLYRIGHDQEHGWWASRRGEVGHLLAADHHEELRAKIYADYEEQPVPREAAP